MNTTAAKVAARTTATGTKVYIHTNCTCSKVNGKVVKGVETVAAGEAYAAEQGWAVTFCKTSQVTEAPAEVEETGDEAQGAPEFEITLDNRDQFGAQRRKALAAIVEAVGAELVAVAGIKNRHRTGNDAFAVQVAKAPAHLEALVRDFFDRVEDEVAEVIEEAKAEGIAEGWDSNTRQKHYKNSARQHIVAEGARVAAELA